MSRVVSGRSGAAAAGRGAPAGPAPTTPAPPGPDRQHTAATRPGSPVPAGTGGPTRMGGGAAGVASPDIRPARLRVRWLLVGLLAVAVALVAGVTIGPVRLNPLGVSGELLNMIPGVQLHTGLSGTDVAIITSLRLPRVCLALLVGAMLSVSGGCYQGIFRNPLADPYLLGVAAGAGLGATVAIAAGYRLASHPGTGTALVVPLAAFGGALLAVALTYALGSAGARNRSPATLILSGVAVAAFLTAVQTYVQMRNVDAIREIYSWLLGSLATSGWGEVRMLLPYAAVTAVVVLALRRELDVLAVGDEEAAALGLHPQRSRYLLIAAASLGTAAAVSVSGLIGFVGLIVPHTVRLIFGSSHRIVLPLSMLFGAAFLALADVVARTAQSGVETPIGVITAFFGAPFFVLVLRTGSRRSL